jgi:hypothetical protein
MVLAQGPVAELLRAVGDQGIEPLRRAYPALMSQIPLFPLGRALYPDGVLNLRVFEIRYLDMIKQCIADHSEFGVVPLLAGSEVRTPEGKEVLASFGTMARIESWDSPMPTLLQLRCIGTTRFRLLSSSEGKYGLWTGEAEALPDTPVQPVPPELQASANTLGKLIADMQHNRIPPDEMPLAPPFRLDECGWVADRWGELLPLVPQQQQELLAEADPALRLGQIQDILRRRRLLDE